MRQYRLPVIRGDGDANAVRDVARAWSRVLDHVTEPALRLRAALSLARTLAGAERAIVFDADRVIAALPGDAASIAARRMFERARRVLEDERVGPDLYVARIAPDRPERLALRWREPREDALEIARAVVASCAWALERGSGERPPANLPDGGATLARMEQLVHDARRMHRSFAVVYVDAEGAAGATTDTGARNEVALRLRRQLRANDHLGHLGGDAYVALLALDASESEAYPAAQRLLDAAGAGACANVGVAICPEDGVQPADLVDKAGAAAMAAASVGGARPYWFRESAGHELGERAAIRRRLREGDPGALVELRFAPVFDGRTGQPRGVKAVAAWREPGGIELAPEAYLACDPDRAARESLERWIISSAASAQRSWLAAGFELDVWFRLSEPSDTMADAIASAFGAGAGRSVMIEIAAAAHVPAPAVESFARRVRALGARVGVAAARVLHASFEGGGSLLDFVVVDARHEVRALAELALASVLAGEVVADEISKPERARWLIRHGATALCGQGLAAPLRLRELVGWASDRRSPLGQ